MTKRLPTFDEDLQRDLKDPVFRAAFEEEGRRMEVVYQIWRMRQKKKMTQKMLAEKLGTTQSAIARIERSEQNITIDLLQRIATVFGKKLVLRFQ